MIVKHKFLNRRRIKLAIRTQFERHSGHSVRLTRCVDSKSVCLTLGNAHHGVEKWRGEKDQRAKNQRQQRKTGWISNSAYTPFVAPPRDSGIKKNSSECEPNEKKNPQIRQKLRAVIENVMTHFVRHHFPYLRQGALVEQIIV